MSCDAGSGVAEALLDAMCGNVARAFDHDLDRMPGDPDGMSPELDALARHLRWNACGLSDGSFGPRVE